jgi:transcriptional regulator of aromatic amino acid metabolism
MFSPIRISLLRERMDDIPLLVEYLIERYAKKVLMIRQLLKIQAAFSVVSISFSIVYTWPSHCSLSVRSKVARVFHAEDTPVVVAHLISAFAVEPKV